MKLNQILSEGLSGHKRQRIELSGKRWVVYDKTTDKYASKGSDRDGRTSKPEYAQIFTNDALAEEKAEAMNWYWGTQKSGEWQERHNEAERDSQENYAEWIERRKTGHMYYSDEDWIFDNKHKWSDAYFRRNPEIVVRLQKAHKKSVANAKRRLKTQQSKPSGSDYVVRPMKIIYELGQ